MKWRPTMKVLTLVLASVLVLAPAPTVPVASGQRSAHESAFSGQPVPKVSHQSPTAVTCESDHADSTGYYPRNWSLRMADPKANAEVLLTSAFERQRQTLIEIEEHTSELQSRVDLVCRLLLEKKKKKTRK